MYGVTAPAPTTAILNKLCIECDENPTNVQLVYWILTMFVVAEVSVLSSGTLYMKATVGAVNTPRPSGYFDFAGKAKWDAWKGLGSMPTEVAMQKYIEFVETFSPAPKPIAQTSNTTSSAESASACQTETSQVVFTSTIYMFMYLTGTKEKDIFHYSSEGDVARVIEFLDKEGAEVDATDDEDRTPLLWAADRGHLNLVKELLRRGANVNHQDSDGQTALHYSVSCGHKELTEYLLTVDGLDKTIPDSDGCLALDLEDLS
ncbi:gamma-secretase-activating protein [Pelomyxa schiedti]|nr:gamma-secretase-activating protein [Pelomyxa schiedti]